MQFNEYGIISVSRKEGAKFLELKGMENINLNNILTLCLPFGDPHAGSLKFKVIDSVNYLTMLNLNMKSEGIGIVVPINYNNGEHNIDQDLILKINKLLISKSNLLPISFKIQESHLKHNSILINIVNIENFFISILIGQKIYIIDDNFQLLNIMMFLFKLFPKELYFLLEFVINSNSFSENTKIIGIPVTKNNLDNLDKISKEKNTILDLDSKICFGNFSSPLIKILLSYIVKDKISTAKNLLTNIYLLASENEDINENLSHFSKKHNINKADALLIIKLRRIIYNKQKKLNVFEELFN